MMDIVFKGASCRARDEQQREMWHGALLLEDEHGAHAFVQQDPAEPLRGKAGPWSVSMSVRPCGHGLIDLCIRVDPSSRTPLRRVYLRVDGGSAELPRLDSPGTKMLALPIDFALQDGQFPVVDTIFGCGVAALGLEYRRLGDKNDCIS